MKKISYLIIVSLFFLNISEAKCTTLNDVNNALSSISTTSFLNSHPVGSIYVTTSSDENTVAKMETKYGGEWQVYGENRVLRGTTGEVEKTSGSNTQTLTINNLPEHSHLIPALSGTASSTGDEYTLTYNTTDTNNATSDANNRGHTHGVPALSGTAASAGAHTHTVSGTAASAGAHTHSTNLGGSVLLVWTNSGNVNYGDGFAITSGGWWNKHHKRQCAIAEGGAHTHTVSGTAASAGAHTHTVTTTAKASEGISANHNHKYTNKYVTGVSGIEAHTHSVTTDEDTTGQTGEEDPSSFSVTDPYITVYRYKRTK